MFILKDIEKYCEEHSSLQSELLNNLERETHLKVQQPHMLSGKLQGRFLSFISSILQPHCILEIGTYTGYSALCLAEGLAPNGILHTIDINDEMESICTKYFTKSKFANKIKMHLGNALEIIPNLQIKPNLVFIDADKTNYIAYFNLIIDMLPSGALVIADNVLFHGEILNEQKGKNAKAIHDFNEFINNCESVTKVMLPLRDGIILIRKE